MATLYVTSDGDMVDEICFRRYAGTQVGTVEKVLAANPDLSRIGEKLPAGLTITLPDIPPPEPVKVRRVWG